MKRNTWEGAGESEGERKRKRERERERESCALGREYGGVEIELASIDRRSSAEIWESSGLADRNGHGGERSPIREGEESETIEGREREREREAEQRIWDHPGLEFAMLRPRIHCLRFRASREKGRELPTVPRARARSLPADPFSPAGCTDIPFPWAREKGAPAAMANRAIHTGYRCLNRGLTKWAVIAKARLTLMRLSSGFKAGRENFTFYVNSE